MTVKEAIEGLRRDIATLELTDAKGVGVSIDAGWPERIACLLASHQRLTEALLEAREFAYICFFQVAMPFEISLKARASDWLKRNPEVENEALAAKA
jgi:hypothetical protein